MEPTSNTDPRPPGDVLRDLLDERGLLQSDLAFILECGLASANHLLTGRKKFTAEVSVALGYALDIPIGYFAELQTAFDLSQVVVPEKHVSVRADIMKYPIRDLIRRGWIREGSPEQLQSQLATFLEVADLANVPHLAHAAKKSSYDEKEISAPQLCWVFRVRQIAKIMAAAKYSETALSNGLIKLRSMMTKPEDSRHIPRFLAECGVRFVLVENLPQSKIDGVCFWLDDRTPVIGMSTRYDRIDNFWFVIRHEIEHVLQRHGMQCAIVDAELEGQNAGTGTTVSNIERIANAAAANFCVPSEKLDSFIKRKHPLYYERDVVAFAKVNGIHPGLVVGQMQHRLNRYDYLRKYQAKIRHFILPGAYADGWGQLLPL